MEGAFPATAAGTNLPRANSERLPHRRWPGKSTNLLRAKSERPPHRRWRLPHRRWYPPRVSTATSPVRAAAPRHTALVRITHWLTVLSFLALLVTGANLIISHPRFYWGETGNSGTTPLFKIPIPASRDTVPSGYNYVMPDENGWSRYLHFEAAWVLVLTGLVYVAASLLNAHFRKNLLPAPRDRNWRAIRDVFAKYLRRAPPDASESHAYNVVQRLSYLVVIFILFPLVILDRPGPLAGIRRCRTGNGESAGRTPVRAHAAFLRHRSARDLSCGPRSHDRVRRFLEADQADDHRQSPRRQGGRL